MRSISPTGSTAPPCPATGTRTLSIGVTETRATEHRLALVRQADLALYEAKQGKLAVVSYQPGARARRDAGCGRRSAGPPQSARNRTRAHGRRSRPQHEQPLRDGGRAGRRYRHAPRDRGTPSRAAPRRGPAARRRQDRGARRDPPQADGARSRRAAADAGARVRRSRHPRRRRFAQEATWVLHHHEHYDGTGYPQGLAGEEIPLESRIIAVADAFEAMTGARPYREALTNEQALAELTALEGTQFDRSCVHAIAQVVRDAGELPRRGVSSASEIYPLQSAARVP